jgi:hypothetical protein
MILENEHETGIQKFRDRLTSTAMSEQFQYLTEKSSIHRQNHFSNTHICPTTHFDS